MFRDYQKRIEYQKNYRKTYKANHREELNAARREYYRTHREQEIERSKRYYQNRKEEDLRKVLEESKRLRA